MTSIDPNVTPQQNRTNTVVSDKMMTENGFYSQPTPTSTTSRTSNSSGFQMQKSRSTRYLMTPTALITDNSISRRGLSRSISTRSFSSNTTNSSQHPQQQLPDRSYSMDGTPQEHQQQQQQYDSRHSRDSNDSTERGKFRSSSFDYSNRSNSVRNLISHHHAMRKEESRRNLGRSYDCETIVSAQTKQSADTFADDVASKMSWDYDDDDASKTTSNSRPMMVLPTTYNNTDLKVHDTDDEADEVISINLQQSFSSSGNNSGHNSSRHSNHSSSSNGSNNSGSSFFCVQKDINNNDSSHSNRSHRSIDAWNIQRNEHRARSSSFSSQRSSTSKNSNKNNNSNNDSSYETDSSNPKSVSSEQSNVSFFNENQYSTSHDTEVKEEEIFIIRQDTSTTPMAGEIQRKESIHDRSKATGRNEVRRTSSSRRSQKQKQQENVNEDDVVVAVDPIPKRSTNRSNTMPTKLSKSITPIRNRSIETQPPPPQQRQEEDKNERRIDLAIRTDEDTKGKEHRRERRRTKSQTNLEQKEDNSNNNDTFETKPSGRLSRHSMKEKSSRHRKSDHQSQQHPLVDKESSKRECVSKSDNNDRRLSRTTPSNRNLGRSSSSSRNNKHPSRPRGHGTSSGDTAQHDNVGNQDNVIGSSTHRSSHDETRMNSISRSSKRSRRDADKSSSKNKSSSIDDNDNVDGEIFEMNQHQNPKPQTQNKDRRDTSRSRPDRNSRRKSDVGMEKLNRESVKELSDSNSSKNQKRHTMTDIYQTRTSGRPHQSDDLKVSSHSRTGSNNEVSSETLNKHAKSQSKSDKGDSLTDEPVISPVTKNATNQSNPKSKSVTQEQIRTSSDNEMSTCASPEMDTVLTKPATRNLEVLVTKISTSLHDRKKTLLYEKTESLQTALQPAPQQCEKKHMLLHEKTESMQKMLLSTSHHREKKNALVHENTHSTTQTSTLSSSEHIRKMDLNTRQDRHDEWLHIVLSLKESIEFETGTNKCTAELTEKECRIPARVVSSGGKVSGSNTNSIKQLDNDNRPTSGREKVYDPNTQKNSPSKAKNLDERNSITKLGNPETIRKDKVESGHPSPMHADEESYQSHPTPTKISDTLIKNWTPISSKSKFDIDNPRKTPILLSSPNKHCHIKSAKAIHGQSPIQALLLNGSDTGLTASPAKQLRDQRMSYSSAPSPRSQYSESSNVRRTKAELLHHHLNDSATVLSVDVEGLTDEQKAWVGIERVLSRNRTDDIDLDDQTASVCTRDVLPESIVQAMLGFNDDVSLISNALHVFENSNTTPETNHKKGWRLNLSQTPSEQTTDVSPSTDDDGNCSLPPLVDNDDAMTVQSSDTRSVTSFLTYITAHQNVIVQDDQDGASKMKSFLQGILSPNSSSSDQQVPQETTQNQNEINERELLMQQLSNADPKLIRQLLNLLGCGVTDAQRPETVYENDDEDDEDERESCESQNKLQGMSEKAHSQKFALTTESKIEKRTTDEDDEIDDESMNEDEFHTQQPERLHPLEICDVNSLPSLTSMVTYDVAGSVVSPPRSNSGAEPDHVESMIQETEEMLYNNAQLHRIASIEPNRSMAFANQNYVVSTTKNSGMSVHSNKVESNNKNSFASQQYIVVPSPTKKVPDQESGLLNVQDVQESAVQETKPPRKIKPVKTRSVPAHAKKEDIDTEGSMQVEPMHLPEVSNPDFLQDFLPEGNLSRMEHTAESSGKREVKRKEYDSKKSFFSLKSLGLFGKAPNGWRGSQSGKSVSNPASVKGRGDARFFPDNAVEEHETVGSLLESSFS